LGCPGFCGNDDGGSDAGDMAMVAVVGSSPVCPRDCLGLIVGVKLKLWRRPLRGTLTGYRWAVR
jgi:hypothetical protein